MATTVRQRLARDNIGRVPASWSIGRRRWTRCAPIGSSSWRPRYGGSRGRRAGGAG